MNDEKLILKCDFQAGIRLIIVIIPQFRSVNPV